MADEEPSSPKASRGRLVALGVTVGSALVALCCSTHNDAPKTAPAASAPTTSDAPTTSAAAPPIDTPIASAAPLEDAGAADAAAPTGPLPRTAGHELDNLYAALRGLEKKTRKQHVRVTWMGDSHGASDFWSGALRQELQTKFGVGGPGFVYVGYKGAHHEQVRVSLDGKWSVHPKGPSTVLKTGDGVWGLGGILTSGLADGPKATLTVAGDKLPKRLLWDVMIRQQSATDEVTLSLFKQPPGGGATNATNKKTWRIKPEKPLKPGSAATAVPGSPFPVRHVTFESEDQPSLQLVTAFGDPLFGGVIVEADPAEQPGVVLDTMGINGARLATSLAWDEEAWEVEIGRRDPSLVILEYGTNEAGDLSQDPERYKRHLTAVMARVWKASPSADCLVLSNTDRLDTLSRNELVRDGEKAAAAAVGCAFWDTYATMGGKGSIGTWRSMTPAKAAGDGIHLNAIGYRELGAKLAKFVLDGYTSG